MSKKYGYGKAGKVGARVVKYGKLYDTGKDDWKKRTCLCCQKEFDSYGKQNRVCEACKNKYDDYGEYDGGSLPPI